MPWFKGTFRKRSRTFPFGSVFFDDYELKNIRKWIKTTDCPSNYFNFLKGLYLNSTLYMLTTRKFEDGKSCRILLECLEYRGKKVIRQLAIE